MVFRALHFHRDAVLDGDLHGAGVGAVVRAGGTHHLALDGNFLDRSQHIGIPRFYADQGRTIGNVPKRMRSIWPMRYWAWCAAAIAPAMGRNPCIWPSKHS